MLGGTGAVAAATLRVNHAGAQVAGDPCQDDSDCAGNLICGANDECSCNPSISQDSCPEGSVAPTGSQGGLDDSCCTASGTCCNRNCVNGICEPAVTCGQLGAECESAACCTDLTCINGVCAEPCGDDSLCDPCEACWSFGTEAFTCEPECDGNEICCDEQCVPGDCCEVEDCIAPDGCVQVGCVANLCIYMNNDNLCPGSCQTCQQDGSCSSDCTAGEEVCCDNACVEGTCCVDADCEPVSCAVVTCGTSNECGIVSLCPPQNGIDYACCPVGPGEDYCYNVGVDGTCCTDDDCPAAIVSDETCLIAGCFDGVCGAIRDNDACGPGTCCCDNGECSTDCCDVCRESGDLCGLVINGTVINAESPRLDCCEGLVCCETDAGSYCSECCADWECPQGSICCAGVCREIECCIDDILTGGNPNDRCPDNCTCFEGLCVDHNQEHCVVCRNDNDCGDDACCCHDGSCSHDCCRVCRHDHECGHGECCCRNGACSSLCRTAPGCKSDVDCAKDTCCCNNGSCSVHCCDKPDDDTPEINTLPNTGTGPGSESAAWITGAALAAGASALLGSLVRRTVTPAENPEA